MRLIRWNPYRNLITVPRDMDRLFTNFGLDFWNTDSVWNPAVDISENEKDYVVKAEIPGLKKNDIKISIEDDMLTLSGERKFENEQKENNYHRVERSYGKFQRAFHLPEGTKADEIKANYKNGVLSLTIPKPEKVKPKEIAIS